MTKTEIKAKAKILTDQGKGAIVASSGSVWENTQENLAIARKYAKRFGWKLEIVESTKRKKNK